MIAKRRLSKSDVVEAAIALVEADGVSGLTLARVARRLDIKPPSLYNHVAGLDALRRDAALVATERLGECLGAAAMGRSGRDALRVTAVAFRTYVAEHPGLYELSAQARPDDEEYTQAALRSTEPVIAILRGCDLDGVDAIHAARTLRSALHGFATLERVGGFGFDVDVNESFEWLVERLADALGMPSAEPDR